MDIKIKVKVRRKLRGKSSLRSKWDGSHTEGGGQGLGQSNMLVKFKVKNWMLAKLTVQIKVKDMVRCKSISRSNSTKVKLKV